MIMTMKKDLLKLMDLSGEDILKILDLTDQLKYDQHHGLPHKYLEGKTLDFVEEQAFQGTLAAHVDGGVPVMVVQADEICDRTLGELFWFFEQSCGISAYMLGVNPFNQPGVEFYKRNMFQLLGKPGYERK